MSIFYNQQQRVFRMDTPGSTYLISIVDEEGFLCHTYYGRRIPDDNMQYLLRINPISIPFRDSGDRKSTRLNSSHMSESRVPPSA